jgi:hypothetical protein
MHKKIIRYYGKYRVGQTQLGSFYLSTEKCTFPFSRVLLDWLVINDQKLPNWVWPTLYFSREMDKRQK